MTMTHHQQVIRKQVMRKINSNLTQFILNKLSLFRII